MQARRPQTSPVSANLRSTCNSTNSRTGAQLNHACTGDRLTGHCTRSIAVVTSVADGNRRRCYFFFLFGLATLVLLAVLVFCVNFRCKCSDKLFSLSRANDKLKLRTSETPFFLL